MVGSHVRGRGFNWKIVVCLAMVFCMIMPQVADFYMGTGRFNDRFNEKINEKISTEEKNEYNFVSNTEFNELKEEGKVVDKRVDNGLGNDVSENNYNRIEQIEKMESIKKRNAEKLDIREKNTKKTNIEDEDEYKYEYKKDMQDLNRVREFYLKNPSRQPNIVALDSNITFSTTSPLGGDKVIVNITITNTGSEPATNLSVRFYMDDTYSDNRFGMVNVPQLPAGESITVGATWVATGGYHTIIVVVDWEENTGYPIEAESDISVPYSHILLVCDDGYSDSGNLTRYYEMFWDLGLVFDTLDCDSVYTLTYEDICIYDYIVWYAGKSYTAMSSSDANALSAFLEDGKGLILTGYEIAYDLADDDNGFFLTNYLYTEYVADDADTNGNISGLPGDPVGSGLEISIVEDGTFYYSSDVIAPVCEYASACFEYRNQTNELVGEYAGLRIDNGIWKCVFLSFALDAVNSRVLRAEILNRSLNYVSNITLTKDVAVISIMDPESPLGADTTVHVKAKIKNVGTADQTDVVVKMDISCVEDISYTFEDSVVIPYLNASETYLTDFIWTTPANELYHYIIRVTCVLSGDERTINDEKNVTILIDSVYDIGIISLRNTNANAWGTMLVGKTAIINANVRNYGNVNINSLPVYLAIYNQYGVEIFNQTQYIMLNISETKTVSWQWTPLEPMGTSEDAYYGLWYSHGSMIANAILPNDEDDWDNTYERYAIVAAYLMDCESGLGSWTSSAMQGNDLWHIAEVDYLIDPDDTAHSAPHAFYCGIDGVGYENEMDDALYSPWFDLTNYSSASFNALFMGQIEANTSIEKYDNFSVEASKDGIHWDVLYDYWELDAEYFEGDHTYYWLSILDETLCDINLTPYIGGKVQIRFRFFSDSDINYSGLYFDDIVLFGDIKPKFDASLVSLNTGIGLINENRQINANVRNNGRENLASVSAYCRIINATSGNDVATLPVQTVTNLGVGSSTVFTWSFTPTEYGTYLVIVNVSCENDEVPNNNLLSKYFYILPLFENDDVETGPRYWSVIDNSPDTDATWQIVDIISHSPIHSWYCGDPLYLYYDSEMDEYLVTQPIKVQNISKFTFWHNYSIEEEWDGGRVEITTDYGNTWQPIIPEEGYPVDYVYVFDDMPAYSGVSNGWEKATFDLSSYMGQTVFLRFHFASDYIINYEGWAIDDICIEYPPENDLAVIDIISPTIVLTNRAINVTVKIKNLGSSSQNTYSLNLNVTNEEGISVYSNTLDLYATISYNEEASYIFTVPYLENSGRYTINAKVILSGDLDTENDFRSISIIASPPLTSENFDSVLNNWVFYSNNGETKWQVTSTNSRSQPNSLWCGNNQTGNYTNYAHAWTITPPFFVSPGLGFRFYMMADFENGYDGGILEISTDGVTWSQLDADNSQGQYDARISPYFSNPLAGKYAFCQDTDWTEKTFDLSDYEGNFVQIRFRFASDSIIYAKGWYIDDVSLTQPSARDLAISEVRFDTNFFEVGIPTVISYKIINHGLEPQAGYKVYLTTNARGITKEQNVTISTPLYHGESILQSFNWTPEYPGLTNISLRVQIENDFDLANNYANFTINVQVPGKILVVDDDNGLGNSGTLPDVEGDLISSLEAGAYSYAYYLVDSWQDGPTYEILSRYEIVIWLLGKSSDHTLTSSDINALSRYLQGGGNLWIIGQDLLSDIGSNNFVRDYLHVDSYTTNVAPCQVLTGLEESEISYDLNLNISANKMFPDLPDALVPTEDAEGVYLSSVQGNYSAISYSGTYNVVFFAYEFSFIETSAEKALLTERIISNFAKIDAYCSAAYQEVRPGGTASFEITIRNLGRETASVNLSNSAIANWDIIRSVVGPITILPKESSVVYLNVTPPTNARAYTVGSIYLYGTSEKGKFSILTTTVVLPIYSISVSSSAPQTALPGAQLDYTIFVTSFANGVSDTVSLTFTGLETWAPSLNVSQVYLPSSQITSVSTANLHLKVPGGITSGEYNLTIYAQSLGDPTQVSSCVVRVIVGSTFGINMNIQMNSITLDPAIATTFRVNLEITNTGNSHDTITISTILPQGWSANAFPETIPAGQTRTVLLDIVVPDGVSAGTYNITIVANSMNSAVNASGKITVTILRPDLVVSSEDITITPTAPKTNEQITVVITVRNEGQGIAKNITVQLFDGNTALGSKTITEIKGSETAEVAITCKLTKAGARELTVRVDSGNKVIELDEANNFASRGISVKSVGSSEEGINPIIIGGAIAAIIALIIVIVLFRNRLFGKKEESEIRQSYAVEETEEVETPPETNEEESKEDTDKEKEDEMEETEDNKEDSEDKDEEEKKGDEEKVKE